MNRPGALQPCPVEVEETPFTSAEAVRLVRAALDRLRRTAGVRDHLASALAILEPPQGDVGGVACPG